MKIRKNEYITLLIISFASVLLFLGVACYYYYYIPQYATGTFQRMTESVDSDGDHHCTTYISYAVNGQPHTGSLNQCFSGYATGDPISIYYLSNHPDTIGIHSEDIIGFIIFMVIDLTFFGFFAFSAHSLNYQGNLRYYRQRGYLITADFSYIKHPTNSKSWRIVCKWHDPQTDKSANFTSLPLTADPQPLIEHNHITSFPVYLKSPGDTTHYIVDLDSLLEAAKLTDSILH